MTFNEWEKMVLERTGGCVYRYGENEDGRCNTSCIKCGSDIYLSKKPNPTTGTHYRFCDC